MSVQHYHYCPKCMEIYSCTADREVDASKHGGPAESVCFHHYGIQHSTTCQTSEEKKDTVIVGGY